MTKPRITVCPICKQEVKCRKPRNGDGTAFIILAHDYEGERCEGSYSTIGFREEE